MSGEALKPEPAQVAGDDLPSIMFLGGPRHGRKLRDKGYGEVHDDEDLYRRVKLHMEQGSAVIEKDVFVFFGKRWEQSIRLGDGA